MDTGFEQFLGKKVSVTESKRKITIAGEEMEIDEYKMDQNDPTISEIKKLRGSGLTRIWLPNSMGTMDFRMDRLNVRIEKVADGSFEVTKVYFG